MFEFDSIYGVDFSGAKLAGRNIWVARIQRKGKGWRLAELSSLEKLCGTPERDGALRFLVDLVKKSERSLWALDFPFALPIEIMPDDAPWTDQLEFLKNSRDGAYAIGLQCLDRARKLGGKLHIRRCTDLEAKTPFDCYHYRII